MTSNSSNSQFRPNPGEVSDSLGSFGFRPVFYPFAGIEKLTQPSLTNRLKQTFAELPDARSGNGVYRKYPMLDAALSAFSLYRYIVQGLEQQGLLHPFQVSHGTVLAALDGMG
jgi:hypothetical protein